MSTVRATADVTPRVLFTAPKVAKGKLTSIKVDNQGTAARTIRIQDRFTPDSSAEVPAPAEQTIDRLQFTVGAGTTFDISQDELQDVEVLGTCQVVADAVEPACVVLVGYHMT